MVNEIVNRYYLVRGQEISPVQELSVEGLPFYEVRKAPVSGDEKDIEDFIAKMNKYSKSNLVFVRVIFVADLETGQRTAYFRFCLVRE